MYRPVFQHFSLLQVTEINKIHISLFKLFVTNEQEVNVSAAVCIQPKIVCETGCATLQLCFQRVEYILMTF